jgi:hypothetical protein
MRAEAVVVVAPRLDDLARLRQAREHVLVQHLSRSLLLKLSMNAFCTGLPGWM